MSTNNDNCEFSSAPSGFIWRVAACRGFFRATTTLLAGFVLSWLCVGCTASKPSIARFGIVSDCHYADKDSFNSRCYRESLAKLTECVEVMNRQEVDFLIELGDFIDEGASEAETIYYVQAVEEVFQQFRGPVYHVLGNHDIGRITKDEFLTNIKNTGVVPVNSRYYSFDLDGLRIVVLDGNYLADGTDCGPGNFEWMDTNIPADELKWFKAELCGTDKPVIVFIHQRLDGGGSFYVNNSADVRRVMEESGKVLAVFQGHHHEGGHSRIGGIHYYTLRAMVENCGQENNSYAVIEVRADGSISVCGYRKAVGMVLGAKCEIADK
ncbi:MAG: metallophosphoesterase family protein [Planctomycetota bacterium]